jgi:hypothetical protein
LSIRVTHRAITDALILVTPKGRRQIRTSQPEAQKPDYTKPMGLYEGSRHAELRLSLRQTEQERVLQAARAKMEALSRSINRLDLPAADNLLLEKTSFSPEPDRLWLQADREATTPATHTVEVHWPAQGRSIQSKPQNPVEPVSLADGAHEFSLFVDGQEHQISINVNNSPAETDTQEDLLRRLALAISDKDSRVAAEVEYSQADAYDPAPRSRPMERTASLKVYSTQSGEGVEFYFEDAGDGSLVSDYGLDAARPQRPAYVEQDGSLRMQSDNLISLDEGHVSGEAYSGSSGPLDIPVRHAAETVPQKLTQLIGQYNDLVNYLSSHSDLLRPSLLDRITRPVQDRYRELPQIGLKANAKGSLNPGAEFETQVQYDYAQVRELLLDDGGWAESLGAKLDQILAMEEDAFALPLSSSDQLEQRRRAWAMVNELSSTIISSYT